VCCPSFRLAFNEGEFSFFSFGTSQMSRIGRFDRPHFLLGFLRCLAPPFIFPLECIESSSIHLCLGSGLPHEPSGFFPQNTAKVQFLGLQDGWRTHLFPVRRPVLIVCLSVFFFVVARCYASIGVLFFPPHRETPPALFLEM